MLCKVAPRARHERARGDGPLRRVRCAALDVFRHVLARKVPDIDLGVRPPVRINTTACFIEAVAVRGWVAVQNAAPLIVLATFAVRPVDFTLHLLRMVDDTARICVKRHFVRVDLVDALQNVDLAAMRPRRPDGPPECNVRPNHSNVLGMLTTRATPRN